MTNGVIKKSTQSLAVKATAYRHRGLDINKSSPMFLHSNAEPGKCIQMPIPINMTHSSQPASLCNALACCDDEGLHRITSVGGSTPQLNHRNMLLSNHVNYNPHPPPSLLFPSSSPVLALSPYITL